MPGYVKTIYAAFIASVVAGLAVGFIGSGESLWVPVVLGVLMVGGMLLVARWLTVKTGLNRDWERAREREVARDGDGVGGHAGDLKQRSWRARGYIAAKLAGPLGVVLVAVGAMHHSHGFLVAGIVLLGAFFLDTVLLFPILRARHDRQRRASRASN
ncbi:MAG: hypothetical protein ACLQMH_16045 [Solirubrobacteraceae bacterium]